MNDFLKDVIKETGNEYAGIVSDGATGNLNPIYTLGSSSISLELGIIYFPSFYLLLSLNYYNLLS